MPTELDVVNQVLNEIGRPSIADVTNSPDAVVIQNKLTVLKPELLQRTDWNFAIRYVQDSVPLSNNFSPDFNYSYLLPGNYDRMDRFSWQTTGQVFGFYYRILDGMILTNANPINYYYVINDLDYAVMPPLFYRALVLYCASTVSMSLTNDKELTAYLKAEYMQKLVDAIRNNDMERYVQSMPYNDFDRTAYI